MNELSLVLISVLLFLGLGVVSVIALFALPHVAGAVFRLFAWLFGRRR